MFTITKTIPVEVIHAEFDSAEARVLSSCNELLSSLKITTEDKLESKASKLVALGFVNSEPVKQFKEFKDSRKKVEEKRTLIVLIVDTIQALKVAHPHDMFITVDELERICNKYDLIHAPVANYIKDIPEQNVIDMSKRKPLSFEYSAGNDVIKNSETVSLKELFKKEHNHYFLKPDVYKFYTIDSMYGNGRYLDAFDNSYVEYVKNTNSKQDIKELTLEEAYTFFCNKKTELRYSSLTVINKTGLFIAAPKSHFDLKDLKKNSKFGFFNVTVHEVKDPVVFEYCINNIVRIVTKWGTDDDKSYLDEGLINETLN